MRQFTIICFLLSSCVSFSQEFGLKEKEALVLGSLQSMEASLKRYPTIYVLVDSMDEHIQRFIKEKFPKKKWKFFDSKEMQVVFKHLGKKDIASGFELNMWEREGNFYLTMGFRVISRYWPGDREEIQAAGMCGDEPDGKLHYDKEKEKWVFTSGRDLYNGRAKKVTEPDRNHCPPTDDNVQFF